MENQTETKKAIYNQICQNHLETVLEESGENSDLRNAVFSFPESWENLTSENFAKSRDLSAFASCEELETDAECEAEGRLADFLGWTGFAGY